MHFHYLGHYYAIKYCCMIVHFDCSKVQFQKPTTVFNILKLRNQVIMVAFFDNARLLLLTNLNDLLYHMKHMMIHAR